MKNQDIAFFEKYKLMDKLCGDFLGAKGGVSEYIRQMDAAVRGPYWVPSWQEDYKQLKRLRWVRNKIAHETSGVPISTEEDMSNLSAFYERMCSGRDPLSLLARAEKRKRGGKSGSFRPVGSARIKLLIAAIFMGMLLLMVFKAPILSMLGLQ